MTTTRRFKVKAGDSATSAICEFAPNPVGNFMLVLAHGAGSDMEHSSMKNLSEEFLERGLHSVRFNFLYREKGKKVPDGMPSLTACMASVADEVRRTFAPDCLILGGRSMGGRAASILLAEGFDCDGLLLLAYPLHAPGKPEKLRASHLPNIKPPVLALSGTRDAFCGKDLMLRELAKLPQSWTMHWLEGADHGFHVTKASGRTDGEVINEIGAVTVGWVQAGLSSGHQPNSYKESE